MKKMLIAAALIVSGLLSACNRLTGNINPGSLPGIRGT
ncbi:hypothetical protein V7P28_32575, partial [Klebsiella michiganensis]